MVWSHEQHVQPHIDRMEREGRRATSPGDRASSGDDNTTFENIIVALMIPGGIALAVASAPFWGSVVAIVGVVATGSKLRGAISGKKAVKPG